MLVREEKAKIIKQAAHKEFNQLTMMTVVLPVCNIDFL